MLQEARKLRRAVASASWRKTSTSWSNSPLQSGGTETASNPVSHEVTGRHEPRRALGAVGV